VRAFDKLGTLDWRSDEPRFERIVGISHAVFPILLPPLRDRREDIPALVTHCVERAGTVAVRTHALERSSQFNLPAAAAAQV
jgi:hypothetical protein